MDILTDAEWKEVLRVYSAADEPLAKQRVARKRLLEDRAAMRAQNAQFLQNVADCVTEIERLKAENARLWAILAQMPCAGEQAAMAGGCGTCPSCEARAKEGQ